METAFFFSGKQDYNFKIVLIHLAKHHFKRLNSVLGFHSQWAFGKMGSKHFETEAEERKDSGKSIDIQEAAVSSAKEISTDAAGAAVWLEHWYFYI